MKISYEVWDESHESRPRSSQEGAWAFAVGDGKGAWTTAGFTGTFTEARKHVIREAATIGRARIINLLP